MDRKELPAGDDGKGALDEGRGMRETARLLKVSAAKVSEVTRMSVAIAGRGL